MTRIRLILFSVLLAIPGWPSTRAQTTTVVLSVADQEKMGIKAEQLSEAHIRGSTPAIIRVLDPGTLAALDADLAAARSAAAASEKNAARLSRLASQDASASRQAAEAAAAQAASDAAHAKALARRLSIDWAPAIAAMSSQTRSVLIEEMIAGKAALLRADAAGFPDAKDANISLAPDGNTPEFAETLGRAGAADARMQTLGIIGVFRGSGVQMLPPGRLLEGRLFHGGEQVGVLIPRAAVIRFEGDDWAYVKTGRESFERRRITGAIRTADGWFVTETFYPDDPVVANGAGSLLAVEGQDEAAELD